MTGEWVIWDFSRDSGSLGTLSIQSGVGGGRNTTRGDIESSITLVVGHQASTEVTIRKVYQCTTVQARTRHA